MRARDETRRKYRSQTVASITCITGLFITLLRHVSELELLLRIDRLTIMRQYSGITLAFSSKNGLVRSSNGRGNN